MAAPANELTKGANPSGGGANSAFTDPVQTARAFLDALVRLGYDSAHWSADELFQRADQSIAYAKEFGMTQMAIAALGPWSPRTTETVDDVKR